VAVVTLTQVIHRPLEDVFATVIDGGEFASWNPTIASSRKLTAGSPGEGSRFEWKLRGFGWVRQELEQFERDRCVRIVPDMRAMSGGHRFTFSDVGGGSTRVDHELEMTPKGFFKILGPMIAMTGRRNLNATAEALKRHLEGP
jgi:uncharacterized protein YndB with AHSA1/START domain